VDGIMVVTLKMNIITHMYVCTYTILEVEPKELCDKLNSQNEGEWNYKTRNAVY
jgi:hypothetical protein